MTCPVCRSAMNKEHDHWNCPNCRGEFYTSTQTQGVDEAWRISMDTYYKAMRNEKETYRVDRKHGYLRIMAQEYEVWFRDTGFY